jgi:hypothetical protein
MAIRRHRVCCGHEHQSARELDVSGSAGFVVAIEVQRKAVFQHDDVFVREAPHTGDEAAVAAAGGQQWDRFDQAAASPERSISPLGFQQLTDVLS